VCVHFHEDKIRSHDRDRGRERASMCESYRGSSTGEEVAKSHAARMVFFLSEMCRIRDTTYHVHIFCPMYVRFRI
jgi:hypothetical protein